MSALHMSAAFRGEVDMTNLFVLKQKFVGPRGHLSKSLNTRVPAMLWGEPSLAGAKTMFDFVERHLGFSPDSGDGTFEVLIIIVTIIAISFVAILWFHPYQAKREPS